MTQRRARIALFTRILPLHGPGGMQAVTQDVAVGLAGLGHDVEVFSTEAPDAAAAARVPAAAGLRVHLLATGSPGRYSRHWTREADAAFRRAHAARPFDVILSISAATRGLLGPWRRAGIRVPVAASFFGTHFDELRAAAHSLRGHLSVRGTASGLARAAFTVFRAVRDVPFMRAPDAVIVPCPGDAVKLRRTFRIAERRLHVIPYGVSAPLRSAIRAVADPSGRLVVVVARLERDKGIQFVLRALAQVRRTVPDVRLRIVGGGSYRPWLEDLARELGVAGAVDFAGVLPYERIAQAYAGASVVVNPRLRPTAYDQALLLAMAAGVPVVVSDFGDVRFVAEPGRDALYVPPGDAEALAAALLECFTQPGAASRYGAAAEARLASRFTLEQTVDEYSALLTSLC